MPLCISRARLASLAFLTCPPSQRHAHPEQPARKHLAHAQALDRARRNRQHDDEDPDDERARDGRDEQHAAAARGELAHDDVVLALKVAVEAEEEHEDGDGDEGGAERLADVVEALARRRGRVRRQRRVEAEELRDGDADGGEGERGAQPGQEGALCRSGSVRAAAGDAEAEESVAVVAHQSDNGRGVDLPRARWSRATEPLFSSSREPYRSLRLAHKVALGAASSGPGSFVSEPEAAGAVPVAMAWH